MNPSDTTQNDLFIAGVGASAGGIEAVKRLVTCLPAQTDCLALVIARHVKTDFNSGLAELLNDLTAWSVVTAEDQTPVKAGQVYVVPPNCEVLIEQGIIELQDRYDKPHATPSIDDFFTSLAQDQQEQAIGIILSGTRLDGAKGVEAIQQNGGHVLVQCPDEARFSGMPEAAIQTDQVDQVLPVNQIGKALARYVEASCH